jgi:hypothetical protein
MSSTIGKIISTIGKVSPTIGKIISTMVEIERLWILLLFNKIAIVSDHGRKGFADWFCLSANGIVSSPMFLALRPTELCLR